MFISVTFTKTSLLYYNRPRKMLLLVWWLQATLYFSTAYKCATINVLHEDCVLKEKKKKNSGPKGPSMNECPFIQGPTTQ
jgi:hypothetical protein